MGTSSQDVPSLPGWWRRSPGIRQGSRSHHWADGFRPPCGCWHWQPSRPCPQHQHTQPWYATPCAALPTLEQWPMEAQCRFLKHRSSEKALVQVPQAMHRKGQAAWMRCQDRLLIVKGKDFSRIHSMVVAAQDTSGSRSTQFVPQRVKRLGYSTHQAL